MVLLGAVAFGIGLDADGKVVVRGTGELDQAAMQQLVGMLQGD